MRGYFSSDGGLNWGGVDLPLPRAIGAHGVDFGSDPSLAFDTRGNTFYSYIVVYFSTNFHAINGTEMAVARSSDGGGTYPNVNFFEFSGGVDHFNDKPMIAADTNLSSPFRDNVYVAWDAALGGSGSGGIRVATSTDHGATFSARRIDHRPGPGLGIGAVPFVGPDGQVYAAWNDFKHNVLAFNRSFDGGVTWGSEHAIAAKQARFDIGIPAESFRRALVYPACDADRSTGSHRGRLYCSWMDLTAAGTTDIFVSFSDDQGASWSALAAVTDQLSFPVDRFNQWLSTDPTTGSVNVSFYDTHATTPLASASRQMCTSRSQLMAVWAGARRIHASRLSALTNTTAMVCFRASTVLIMATNRETTRDWYRLRACRTRYGRTAVINSSRRPAALLTS